MTRPGSRQSGANERPPRLGPRPLPLHLAVAATTWLYSLNALPLWRDGLLPLSPGSPELLDRAKRLHRRISALPATAVDDAVQQAVRDRSDRLFEAINRYRAHPYRRQLPEPPVCWQDGASRLLDFGSGAAGDAATPLLLVPSLINRSYIFDLSPRISFARWLTEQGYRCLLLDWGYPGEAERSFGLAEYVAGRLEQAQSAALEVTGRRPLLIGYCMGGLLALAQAQRRPEAAAGLIVLATPWDFHAALGQAALGRTALLANEAVMNATGVLPVDVIQALFAAIDPFATIRKFLRFAGLQADGREAEDFVALEDWLNDGVPLVCGVARECLGGWYAENRPVRRQWDVAGTIIDPGSLELPSLVVVPDGDRIVPPATALPLVNALPKAQKLQPVVGHIGMMASRRARQHVWKPIVDWIAEQAPTPAPPRRRRAAVRR